MKILIKNIKDNLSRSALTNCTVDIQSNGIAIIELTGSRNIVFELKVLESKLPYQLVEIVNRLNSMDLTVNVDDIYVKYVDVTFD